MVQIILKMLDFQLNHLLRRQHCVWLTFMRCFQIQLVHCHMMMYFMLHQPQLILVWPLILGLFILIVLETMDRLLSPISKFILERSIVQIVMLLHALAHALAQVPGPPLYVQPQPIEIAMSLAPALLQHVLQLTSHNKRKRPFTHFT